MSELATDIGERMPEMVPPDSLSAVAGYVNDQYGQYGYRVGIVYGDRGRGLFEVRCSDGASFHLVADQWGNVTDVHENETAGQALARLPR
jgi:hypothetical protein